MHINENTNSEEKNESQDIEVSNFKKENESIKASDSDLNYEEYKFGWNKYAEITNGRFAMIGLFAIILIEFLSKTSFLKWSGIIN